MEQSFKNQTIKSVIWNFIDLVINQLLSIVVQIFLARLLFPSDFGLIGIVVVIITVAQVIVDGGFSNALIRDLETTEVEYSTVFFFNLFVSLILYGILFLTAPLISDFYLEPKLSLIIRVISIVIIINALGFIQRIKLTKNLEFKIQTIINSISSLFSGLISIYLAYVGYGVWSLVFYTVSRQILQIGLYIFSQRWHPTLVFSKIAFLKYFTFGWKLLISSLIDTIYGNLNNLIIGKLFNKTQLGYFTNASKFSNIPQQSIHGVISKVSYPVLSKLQNDDVQLKHIYKKIVLNSVFINFPVMIGLIVIAEPLFLLLLGDKWLSVIPMFQILSLSGIIFPLQAINLNILQVKDRTDLFLKLTIIKKVIGITLVLIVLLLKNNIYWLLWIGVLDSIVIYFVNSYYSRQLLNYSSWRQIRDLLPTLLSATLMGFTVYIVNLMLSTSSQYQIISIDIIVGVISYIIYSKIFKVTELKSTIIIFQDLLKRNKRC